MNPIHDSHDQMSDPAWQRDVPPATDTTFVLATLRRMEQRRWRGELLYWCLMSVVVLTLSYLLWPLLNEQLNLVTAIAVQDMTFVQVMSLVAPVLLISWLRAKQWN